MLRIETVYESLLELTKEKGISAGELAETLGLARANVSNDLNRLCDDGRASKEGTKPVLYRGLSTPRPREDSVFDRLARESPSLFQAAEQAKAAVLYPPRGMPILLLGETGVGKSRFAELIHLYAVEMGRLGKDSPFVVFNCADYASNPQLLVSHLFGAKKGAFTGADADRAGLLEKADRGILFLDEVHRLPPEGQEMLFSFFDRGCFRRLGDSETERRADVLIVAATTEPPASALLATFTRRIPMVIKIPSLGERGLDERLELLRSFFSAEAARLGKPIQVSVNAVRAIMAYHCPSNVGQLKSDIQLLCARAYSDLITRRSGALQIVTASLPPHIKEGLVSETCHRQLWYKINEAGGRFLVFDAEGKGEEGLAALIDPGPAGENVYDLIDARISEMRARGLGGEELGKGIDGAIRGFFAKTCLAPGGLKEGRVRELVGEEIDGTVSAMLDLAAARLGRPFPPYIKNGLSLHVMNAIRRVRSGGKIAAPEFSRIRKEHPDEFGAAVDCLRLIDQAFELSMPLEEAGLLAMFFVFGQEKEASLLGRPAIVVMAHGESTASSMAKTCNELLGLDAVTGIDVRLEESPRSAYSRLKEGLSGRAPRCDLLLLVDMGSLMNFGADLETDLGIRVRTIPLASTLHVLQAARKALMGRSLDEVYEDVRKIDELMARRPETARPEAAEEGPGAEAARSFVVALCTTGEGSAAFLKSRLEGALAAERGAVEVLSLGIAATGAAREALRAVEARGRILCVVSPFRLGLPYREFGADEVLTGAGLERVRAFVDGELLFQKIIAAQAEAFHEVDAREALESARDFVESVEEGLGRELLDGPRVGVYCHIASLLERERKGEESPLFPDRKAFIARHEDAFALVRNEATRLEARFSVKLSADEICRIVSFFAPENCASRAGQDAQGGAGPAARAAAPA